MRVCRIFFERIINKKKCTYGRFAYSLGCTFEGGNLISSHSIIKNTRFGYGSYVGKNCELDGVKIGKYTCIGPNVINITGQHPTRDFVSIHPAFFSKQKQVGFTYVDENKFEEYRFVDEENLIRVEIGNDVWIGAGVTIIDGVKICDGAIIAAGAVVNKDVEPYSIVGGVPAKKIGERFSENDKQFLLKLKWWNKDCDWLINNASSFEDIKKFRKEIN